MVSSVVHQTHITEGDGFIHVDDCTRVMENLLGHSPYLTNEPQTSRCEANQHFPLNQSPAVTRADTSSTNKVQHDAMFFGTPYDTNEVRDSLSATTAAKQLSSYGS